MNDQPKRDQSNPFVGLEAWEASEDAYELLARYAKTLPRRPALPHEYEDSGLAYYLTKDGPKRYEAEKERLLGLFVAAGHPKDKFGEGPITYD